MQTRETTHDPLLPTEADGNWDLYCPEVATSIVGFIRTMGLPPQHSNLGAEHLGRMPTKEQVRRALLLEFELHDRVLDGVERDFRRAVRAGRVDRDRVGGFLNTATQRKAWKLVTRRAKILLATLEPHQNAADVLANVPDPGTDPEEILTSREAFERLGRAMADLSIGDQQLIDAKLAGDGYAGLAAVRGTTVGALKTHASRLWQALCIKVRGEARPANGRGRLPPNRAKKAPSH